MHEIGAGTGGMARHAGSRPAGRAGWWSPILITGICLAVTATALSAQAGTPPPAVPDQQLSKGKQTTLGLYVTAREAYELWKAAPDRVKLIDVRTPEEFALIGHPEMAWNIPIGFITYRRTGGKFEHGERMNQDFVAEVRGIAQPTDTLLLMCRSGGRSAMAVNLLAAAGFTHAYSITDGMEGDKVDDPGSVFNGKRMKNGWKNWGLPWVYSIDPEKVLIEEADSNQTTPAQ
jgi:rhodanese-related sulfurtransferase